MEYIQVTYRRIAKMLASKLPVEGEEFGLKVEEYLTAIKAMPQETKTALKVAYVFSRKVPNEEREDTISLGHSNPHTLVSANITI